MDEEVLRGSLSSEKKLNKCVILQPNYEKLFLISAMLFLK